MGLPLGLSSPLSFSSLSLLRRPRTVCQPLRRCSATSVSVSVSGCSSSVSTIELWSNSAASGSGLNSAKSQAVLEVGLVVGLELEADPLTDPVVDPVVIRWWYRARRRRVRERASDSHTGAGFCRVGKTL